MAPLLNVLLYAFEIALVLELLIADNTDMFLDISLNILLLCVLLISFLLSTETKERKNVKSHSQRKLRISWKVRVNRI